jgi:Protein of unknown function (DUF1579)
MLMEYLTIFCTFWVTKNIFMKPLTFVLLALAAVCTSLSSSAQTSDEMQAMMAYSTPGDIHKMLAKSTGSWSATLSMWMQPDAKPVSSTASCVNEMILGGRYLQAKNKGVFMGQPFEGIGLTGYDNAKKQFVSTWVDNMGTGIMTMTGSWDEASKSIRYSGMMVDPSTSKDIPVREVWRFVDDNNQVMEMYASSNGKEFKTMEVKYTRQ